MQKVQHKAKDPRFGGSGLRWMARRPPVSRGLLSACYETCGAIWNRTRKGGYDPSGVGVTISGQGSNMTGNKKGPYTSQYSKSRVTMGADTENQGVLYSPFEICCCESKFAQAQMQYLQIQDQK